MPNWDGAAGQDHRAAKSRRKSFQATPGRRRPAWVVGRATYARNNAPSHLSKVYRSKDDKQRELADPWFRNTKEPGTHTSGAAAPAEGMITQLGKEPPFYVGRIWFRPRQNFSIYAASRLLFSIPLQVSYPARERFPPCLSGQISLMQCPFVIPERL